MYIDQTNRTKNLEIKPHQNTFNFFYKSEKQFNGRRTAFSTNPAEEIGH